MDVFLSHSTADMKLAERLTKGLEGQGLSVWFDGHELSPGGDWRHEIEQAIRSARNVVLLIDRKREPDNVQEFTWRAALEAAWQDARKRLIPVLRRGAELPRFVLSGSSGSTVPVVSLEDARALQGVVETIVQLANGKEARRAGAQANRPSGAGRHIEELLDEERQPLDFDDPDRDFEASTDAADQDDDPDSDQPLGFDDQDRNHEVATDAKRYQQPGEREQRLDEIERYARTLK